MAAVTEFEKLKHLYHRAGCGLDVQLLYKKPTLSKAIDNIFSNSRTYRDIDFEPGMHPNRESMIGEKEVSMQEADSKPNKNPLKISRSAFRAMLIHDWINQFAFSPAFFREKMAIFWGLHFACKIGDPLVSKHHVNMLRRNALGNLKDLVIAVSTSPGMLSYLNANVSIKGRPNENFIRELMEIFTLGNGHFTEADVKNGARAFTGWGFDKTAYRFKFDKEKFDFETKTFLGTTGPLNGFDIIDIILKQKQCARFIVRKIYLFFVSDNVDESFVNELADYFYTNNYNIELLMRKIFNSDFFYLPQNIGCKLKTPYEAMAGMMKFFNFKFDGYRSFLAFNNLFGHDIFHPPTVAGWNFEKGSIDIASLVLRLDASRRMFKNNNYKIINLANGLYLKDSNTNNTLPLATFNLAPAGRLFNGGNNQESIKRLIDFLIQTPFQKFNHNSSFITQQPFDLLNTAKIIMSTPEYQFC